ncbi:hypothetical protein RF11_16110 [Thelohanellus kitauei]|uniref:Uncharacterized protein n=1 Tax=Thelohanellus kitauei TaxID=669202 RepID=A0A0C2J9B9_THEKT|nr:hypothetical protein RF11_16110 [Thelohanellus kitauei]
MKSIVNLIQIRLISLCFCITPWKIYLLCVWILFYIQKHFVLGVTLLSSIHLIRIQAKRSYLKKGSLESQRSFLTKFKERSRSSVFASNEFALFLARKKKPFTDAEEIIKHAFNIAVAMLGYIKCKIYLIGSPYQIYDEQAN